MKIHLVFYITFLNHIVTDSLSSQILESRESLIVENDERIWYVNNILNFKRDRRYNSSLLKYYVDWEDHFSIWEFFHILNNCQQVLDKYHQINFFVEDSHLESCVISDC